MPKIIILGAGLTGISTAYHLEKEGFFDYQIVEKEDEIGGLCRSIEQDGFIFDYTGHLLHTNNEYFFNLIKEICNLDSFHLIHRKSYIYSHNTFTRYPFQTNLFGLPQHIIQECIDGYKNRPCQDQPIMFIDWVMQEFGSGFAKHFFIPYQEKIFAYDAQRLTADWTNRFVPKTSLSRIEQGAYQDIDDEQGYNAHFYYPRHGGIVSWVKQLASKLTNTIMLNTAAQHINIQEKKIELATGDSLSYEILINTIPLNTCINLLKGSGSGELSQATQHLKCNSVINFNLGIARNNLTDKHWIYFPEHAFPFYRLGFPHNFSSHNAPPQCSSLYGEIAAFHTSPEDNEQRITQALHQIKTLFNLRDEEIICEKRIHIPHAYVIFDQWRKDNLPQLLNRLHEYDIESIGRYGAWKYASMQEAVLDGKETAEKILRRIA